MKMRTTFFATIVGAMLGTVTNASATIFQTDYNDFGVWQGYDDVNESYAFKFTDSGDSDGFWLVVTDGDNPKGDGSSHAILYGDIKNNRITAYTYDGTNSANSYEAGTLLGTYENAFQDAGTRDGLPLTMFTLDTSMVNMALDTPEWDGITTGATGGIWFHKSTGSEFTYGENGELTDYVFASQTFLDKGNYAADALNTSPRCPESTSFRCDTTELTKPGGGSVPAPGGLALILAALGVFGVMRKRG